MSPQEQVERCMKQLIEQEIRMAGVSVLVRHHGREVLYA